MPLLVPFLAAVAGLLLGSFLNVCIARLPQHRSIVWPGSHCPRCGAAIRAFDNIPLISYGLLRGRCRSCGEPISPRYPLVELGLAALFVACAVRFPAPLVAGEAAALCFLLLGLFWMDAETLLLPDSFTLPGAVLGLVQALLPGGGLPVALHLGETTPLPLSGWPPVVSSFLGAVLGAAFLWFMRASYRLARKREGMGLGDVKLAMLVGAWLGVTGVGLTLVLGILLGAVAGVGVLLFRGGNAGALRMPFGSFLCAAGLLVLLRGREMLAWYFHFWL